MPKDWIKKRKREHYYRKAKKAKYRSRAAYKLLQAVKRYRFMKPGDVVVDLGAAPGGWTQASRKIVGSKGFVLGVDLKQVEPFNSSNVKTLIGDIRKPEVAQQIRGFLPCLANVVISDVAQNVSGVWELDHSRQIDLATHSLRIATLVLRPKGSFFVKTFHGGMLDDFMKLVRQHFAHTKRVKPKASRAKSSESYVLGTKFE
ncbi:MAG: RlmE family RNA methyltransferase [Candidatus Bathyarchaeota archaeon]|nr:MAG: RlmE family RNA methyltransferase [Candidatus Bathyarchaeota archaeon]